MSTTSSVGDGRASASRRRHRIDSMRASISDFARMKLDLYLTLQASAQ
jgi:hypothetical protein